MSIRRKSTTHDLATLRLHPDGSRVQQSSVNARRRTASSTVLDSRGNWFAKDAGGKTSVKTRRATSTVHAGDAEGEFIDLSSDEEHDTDSCRQNKSKSRAHDVRTPDEALQEQEQEQLDARSKRRLSFMQDLSFLDPSPVSVSFLEQETDTSGTASGREPVVSFSDPDSDLLKAIHHFASCHYRERGQLYDSSRSYRGIKNARRKESRRSIHTLEHQISDSETIPTDTEDESTEEEQDAEEIVDSQDSGKDGPKTKGDGYEKDMYKALDGSALMAIGIVLQEFVAHTLSPRSDVSEESRVPKRSRTV